MHKEIYFDPLVKQDDIKHTLYDTLNKNEKQNFKCIEARYGDRQLKQSNLQNQKIKFYELKHVLAMPILINVIILLIAFIFCLMLNGSMHHILFFKYSILSPIFYALLACINIVNIINILDYYSVRKYDNVDYLLRQHVYNVWEPSSFNYVVNHIAKVLKLQNKIKGRVNVNKFNEHINARLNEKFKLRLYNNSSLLKKDINDREKEIVEFFNQYYYNEKTHSLVRLHEIIDFSHQSTQVSTQKIEGLINHRFEFKIYDGYTELDDSSLDVIDKTTTTFNNGHLQFKDLMSLINSQVKFNQIQSKIQFFDNSEQQLKDYEEEINRIYSRAYHLTNEKLNVYDASIQHLKNEIQQLKDKNEKLEEIFQNQ